MTEILFPDGYGTARITMAEMQRRHAHLMEPEYARRLFSYLKSCNGKFGIGGGWRPTPSNTSEASKLGQSFHQTQTFADGTHWYCGVDLVVYRPGNIHGALAYAQAVWQGSAKAKEIGLHMNTDESWHMQPIEIDGWSGWVNGGKRRPKPNYPITGAIPVKPPPAVPGFPPFSPSTGQFSLYPYDTGKKTLYKGMAGQPMDLIRYFQGVCRLRANLVIAIDGYYGDECKHAAELIQGWNNQYASGRVDAALWGVIDAMAKR